MYWSYALVVFREAELIPFRMQSFSPICVTHFAISRIFRLHVSCWLGKEKSMIVFGWC